MTSTSSRYRSDPIAVGITLSAFAAGGIVLSLNVSVGYLHWVKVKARKADDAVGQRHYKYIWYI